MKQFKSWLIGAGLAIVTGLILVPLAMAASPFAVTVSSVVPNGSANGSAQFTAAGYPNATGVLSARKITVAYTTTSLGAQTEYVELWNACTSSTTATLKWRGIVQSTITLGGNGPFLNVDIAPRLMQLTSPCFTRSANDITNGTIKASLFYE